MALLIPRGGSEFWGEFEINGKRLRLPLEVPVRGERPTTLRVPGDVAFERSRALALSAFEDKKRELTDPKRAAARLERIHELVSGVALEVIRPSDLLESWRHARRKGEGLSNAHVANVQGLLRRFELFMANRYPRATDIRGVTVVIAEEFMRSEEERGVASKTYNNHLGTMAAVFATVSSRVGLAFNPFGKIPKKAGKMVHRRPFEILELERILIEARNDEVVGPVVIAAVCTGMRRSDCVRLQWRNVDLERGEMSLSASKTGEPLFIPIFAPLRSCLEALPRKGPYCFPAAVTMLARNPDGLTWRLSKILRSAGIAPAEASATYGRRLKAPSLQGFHALKTSFVTLSLNAGISMEIVRKVVGNTVVEVVRKHYFRPSKENVKAEFQSKLPAFMSNRRNDGVAELIAEATTLIEAVKPTDFEHCRGQLLEVLNRASAAFFASLSDPAG